VLDAAGDEQGWGSADQLSRGRHTCGGVGAASRRIEPWMEPKQIICSCRVTHLLRLLRCDFLLFCLGPGRDVAGTGVRVDRIVATGDVTWTGNTAHPAFSIKMASRGLLRCPCLYSTHRMLWLLRNEVVFSNASPLIETVL
jgi:hypothetical protein